MSPQHIKLYAASSPRRLVLKQELGTKKIVTPSHASSEEGVPIPSVKKGSSVPCLRVIYMACQQIHLYTGADELDVQRGYINAQDWLTTSDDTTAFLEASAALVLHVTREGVPEHLNFRVREEDITFARSAAQKYIEEDQPIVARAFAEWLKPGSKRDQNANS